MASYENEAKSDDMLNETCEEDSLTFSNGVLEKIVALALRDVKDVLGLRGNLFTRVQEAFGADVTGSGITVEVLSDGCVRVNISAIIRYGSYAPHVFEDVKETVTDKIESTTGLSVSSVHLRIEDILTEEEYNARQRKQEEDQHDE